MISLGKVAAVAALCAGVAACAPRGTDVGYPSSYGRADPYRYSRYDGSIYNFSDGSDPNYDHFRNRSYSSSYGGSAYGGTYVAPPPPRSAYDPFDDPYGRTYYRDYSATESGWYDRYGRWHRSRAY